MWFDLFSLISFETIIVLLGESGGNSKDDDAEKYLKTAENSTDPEVCFRHLGSLARHVYSKDLRRAIRAEADADAWHYVRKCTWQYLKCL